jgi:pimeloyl-ACP methyl ester carboxylesterase
MERLRTYGAGPFTVIVVHGGPGAIGAMASVARELAANWGVVETLHTARSIAGQIQELRTAVVDTARPPVAIVGHSWGAMLGYLFAAHEPQLVRKLVLVGSGVYEDRYAAGIDQVREARLSPAEHDEVRALTSSLQDATVTDTGAAFSRLGAIFAKADTYDALPHAFDDPGADADYEVFLRVWPEAQALRASGALARLGRRIRCSVVAIHGDYDPHPAAGIAEPLSAVLTDFRLVLLEQCGHEPWIERHARDTFYRILREELSA